MIADSFLRTGRMYIDGRWVEATDGRTFEVVYPYTQEAWATVPRAAPADAVRAVEAAARAFRASSWSGVAPTRRGQLLWRLAELVEENIDELARIEVLGNGKRISEVRNQMRMLPNWFRYFGGLADKVEGAVTASDKPGVHISTRHEPLGVILAITPWNSPLLLAAYKLAPALAAGNTIVLKPSEYTPVSSLELARLIERAGFPAGVVNVVTGFPDEIGKALLRHPKVAKVTFTGGEQGGAAVYAEAARGFKPVALELGGKSPNIVFADADLDNALNGVLSGIFAASGQTCIAGSRLIVERSIHDEFVRRLVDRAKLVRMGDPLDPETEFAPVATRAQFEKILSYIDVARAEGAIVACGGKAATLPECGNGLFVEPTILTGVRNTMRIAREEVFGPVLAVIPFDTEAEAVALANDTDFGLAAGVWTRDVFRAVRMTQAVDAGTVWVNTYRQVSFVSPFGGFKRSGLGRENGQDAIFEFLQTKSVWLGTEAPIPSPFDLR